MQRFHIRFRAKCFLHLALAAPAYRAEEFKLPGVSFTSEGKMEHGINLRISAASAVMQLVYRSVVVKEERSRKAKLSN